MGDTKRDVIKELRYEKEKNEEKCKFLQDQIMWKRDEGEKEKLRKEKELVQRKVDWMKKMLDKYEK